jgi:hypothetical protein
MTYEYRCKNNKCTEFGKIYEIDMSINEYTEEKLPLCTKCKEKTVRNYNSFGLKTFGDGYKA